jgi:hypothetical protein
MHTFTSLTFATTVWVVNRVHHHTANGWANTLPALCTGFTQATQAMFFVGDFTQSGAAINVNLTHFT